MGNKTETIFRLWLGPKFVVLVTDPADIKVVSNSINCMDRSDLYNSLAQILGHGLFVFKYKEWKERRRTLNPSFNVKQLKSFLPIFNKATDIMIDSLKEQRPAGEVFDIYRVFDRCTLDTVCRKCTFIKVDQMLIYA